MSDSDTVESIVSDETRGVEGIIADVTALEGVVHLTYDEAEQAREARADFLTCVELDARRYDLQARLEAGEQTATYTDIAGSKVVVDLQRQADVLAGQRYMLTSYLPTHGPVYGNTFEAYANLYGRALEYVDKTYNSEPDLILNLKRAYGVVAFKTRY